jgi:hypothetical protein
MIALSALPAAVEEALRHLRPCQGGATALKFVIPTGA